MARAARTRPYEDQCVGRTSEPDASSPAALTDPPIQGTHALPPLTRSFAAQYVTAQVAAVSVPALHELVTDTVYPALHVGWHVDPLARELVQSPTPPFVGAADASQAFAEHVAAVSVPALHELVPETV